MKKICIECKKDKLPSDFYKKSNGKFHSKCIDCTLESQCRRLRARKAKAIELCGGKCCNCGYSKNLAALEFHHLEPHTKEYQWNKLSRQPWKEVITELKKCILVCRNCHAEIHYPHMLKELVDVGYANKALTTTRFRSVESSGVCPICNVDVFGTTYCSIQCANEGQRKVVRPDKKTLKKEISEMSFANIGKKYGVTDNAVRKWARKYGLIE